MVLSLRRLLCSLALPLLGAVFLAGCHPKVTDPHDPNFVVAETPDWSITRGELDHERDAFLKEKQVQAGQLGNTQMAAIETAVLRNMVLEKLLLARAATKNFTDVDKDEADALGKIKGRFPSDQVFADKLKQSGVTEDELKKRIHEQVLIEKLFEAEAVHDPEPTEPEVEAFYDGHKNLFNIPPKVRASRVLVMVPESSTPEQKAAKKKIIDAARARVAKGEEFSKVAMQMSEDRDSAPKGGDIGFFQRGENEPGFDEVAFASKVGVLSPVFLTPLGYQFIEITDTRPQGVLPLVDARSAILDNLGRAKVAQQEHDYVDQVLKSSNVKYNISLTEPPADASAPPDGAPPTSEESAPASANDSSAPATVPPQGTPVTNAAPGGP
jgi:parvulin-like peptidyl-prolyl isomerase